MKNSNTEQPRIRFLPISLRRRVEHSPNLLRILSNTSWLFADKLVRMGIGLLVGVWVARYLGPEQFGLLNYATAFVALFGAIATLGLNGIVVRDLVKEPENANSTLGTAFFLQILGGLLAFALMIVAISYARPNDALVKIMVTVLGFVMVFKSTEVVKYWFESQVESKYTVWVESSIFLLIATIKVTLILNEAPLMTFVWAAFAESAVVGLGLITMYAWRGGRLRSWQIHYQRVKTLLNDSWPLILSGIAIMIQARIDQIMIGDIVGDYAVGQYSAALRIVEFFTFIPMIIISSLGPSITNAKTKDEKLYHHRLTDIYRVMLIAFMVTGLPLFIFGDNIVTLLYGVEYFVAGELLPLFAVRLFLAYFGVGKSLFIRNEGMFRYSLACAVTGTIVNVFLNSLWIPVYGASGAIAATIASFSITVFVLDVFYEKARLNLWLMATAMISPVKFRKRGLS